MAIAAWIVLAPLAAGMAATTAFIIRWAADARGPLRASVVVFLLLMMAAMIGGAAFYFASPSSASLVGGLWLASGLMSASAVLVFLGFFAQVQARAGPPVAESSSTGLVHPRTFLGVVVGLVVLNELLMGWTFQTAAGQSITGGWSLAGLVGWLSAR